MKWTLGGSGSSMRVWTDHPSFNPAPTFNEIDPSEARFYPLDVGLAVSITRFLSDPLAATVATVVPELVVQLARADQQFAFKEGDPVLIKYWGEDNSSFSYDLLFVLHCNVQNLTIEGLIPTRIFKLRLPSALWIRQPFSPSDDSDIPILDQLK